METKNLLVSFVACIAFVALLAATASAIEFATIDKVTVNGIEGFENEGAQSAAVFAGDTIPVRVVILAQEDESDVRIVARLIGEGSFSEVSKRFAVIETNGSNFYSALLNVKVPFDIDPTESLKLEITVESSDNGVADRITVPLQIQRESYLVDFLSVNGLDQIEAGKILALDVVLANRGYEEAKNVYLRATIPELGVSNTVYFGDMTPEDQSNPDKEDAEERRLYLTMPRNAAAGVYTIELEAYNTDSSTSTTKRIVVVGAGDESQVLSSVTSRTFAAGQIQTYSLTLVNSGDRIKVYDLIVDAPAGLSVEAEDSMIVVPAGSSKTVRLNVVASDEGTYNFAVNVHSDGQLLTKQALTAVVQGNATKVNASVVLTVVLAVIFVVLVIVLIVLLTRKPQKTEEFGESYY